MATAGASRRIKRNSKAMESLAKSTGKSLWKQQSKEIVSKQSGSRLVQKMWKCDSTNFKRDRATETAMG